MPPDGRQGGSPEAPAPSVRALWVALLPVAPSLPLPHGRASAPPCFCGLLLRAALFAAIMPPDGRLGGSPEAPAPLPLPHGRASAPPCFCGLLWWAALFAAIDGWALSRCRPPFGRPHARSCPLGFSTASSGKLSLVVRILASFARAIRSSAGFSVGFSAPFCCGCLRSRC